MSIIKLTAASRIGCVRTNNEDMILAYDKFVRSDIYQTEFMTENLDRFVIALADGMGGHNAGEVASSDTLNNLNFFLNDLPNGLASGEFDETMMEWLHSINQMISSKGHVNPEMAEMGTTLVGVIYYNHKYYWMNCGDSRLYRFRNGELKQLHPENYYARSQDLQKIYHDSNQFFLFKTYALLRDKKLYTQHTLPFILEESESQDIDTPEDWKLMEMKYDLLHQKD